MVIFSKLLCVQTYHLSMGQVAIIPGRNAYDDGIGRELMALPSFQDALKHAQPGTLIIEIQPAPLPKEEAEEVTAGEKGKPGRPSNKPRANKEPTVEATAVSSLGIGEAIKVIRTLTVADQIESIYNKDPREEVKEECQKRLDKLIAEATAEAAKKSE
jgi:hypothetical protein